MKMIAEIAEDLVELAYPVDKLKLLPGNYNKGNIKAVAKSLSAFKQRKPIVARLDGEYGIVLAGNTTFLAARDELGWTHVAVSFADDLDEKYAIGYAIADNETARLGEIDTEKQAAMIELIQDDPLIFDSIGLDDIAVDDIFEQAIIEERVNNVFPDDDDEPAAPAAPRAPGNPVIQYTIVFDDEAQQQQWFLFIRALKGKYPDIGTVAGRLSEFLEDNLEE